MWAVRILNGPMAGQIFNLKMGKNILGRSAQADIKIMVQGISKTHCEIQVFKDKIVLIDLNSSNGTFLNGVKIQNAIVRLGEKFSLHQILMDIVPATDQVYQAVNLAQPPVANPGFMPQPHQIPGLVQNHPQVSGAPQFQAAQGPHAPAAPVEPPVVITPMTKIQDYLNRVVLPGVYKLAQVIEFKWVLGGFVAAYIFVVTLLSMVPMIQISKNSIMQESQRRASTLARQIANNNKRALADNRLTELNLYSVDAEEGVSQALIVQDTGMILSPSEKAGRNSNLPFVNQARKERREFTAQIDGTTIGAAVPIDLYDANTNEMVVKAYAVIIYDVSSLAFDQGKMISLFMQTLMISSLVGALLFFFLYKLIEFPIQNLAQQLDAALREKRADLHLVFQFEAVQNLISNMNSVLTRYIHGESEQQQMSATTGSSESEAENLVQMIGGPGLVISPQGKILAANSNFEQISRTTVQQLKNTGLSAVQDQALQQNIDHLMSQAAQNVFSIHSDQLEFSGHLCRLLCQAFTSNGNINFYFITILPVDGQKGDSAA